MHQLVMEVELQKGDISICARQLATANNHMQLHVVVVLGSTWHYTMTPYTLKIYNFS